MKKLFFTLSGLFTAVPGLLTMRRSLPVPQGYAVLFGGVLQATGCLGLLLLWLNRSKLKKLRAATLTRATILCLLLFGVCLSGYVYALRVCDVTVHIKQEGDVYAFYPLWPSGTLAQLVAETGSRQEALMERRDGVVRLIAEAPFATTTSLLLLLWLYALALSSLVVAFGVAGFGSGTNVSLAATQSSGQAKEADE